MTKNKMKLESKDYKMSRTQEQEDANELISALCVGSEIVFAIISVVVCVWAASQIPFPQCGLMIIPMLAILYSLKRNMP